MVKNFFKITIRNVIKQKGYSFINISSLAVGIACSVLILLWVQNELSYDKFHENADRIYRLETYMNLGKQQVNVASSNFPIGPTLKKDYSEVQNFVRIREYLSRSLVQYKENKFFENSIIYADSSIFDVFTFPVIRGDSKTSLVYPNSIVITEKIAKKYFGDEDPIGKILDLDNGDKFTVTAIIRNIPRNSHLNFNMVCSFETLRKNKSINMERWMGDFQNYTYILFKEKVDPNKYEQIFPRIIEKEMGQILKAIGGKIDFFLRPLTNIHLYSNLDYDIPQNGDIKYVYIFSFLALFILLIACINFMNLSTARSATRWKEIGIRKALGANRGKLIIQFYFESFTFTFVSILISLLIVELAIPFVNTISGSELSLSFINIPWLLPAFIGLTLLVGFISGSYPALFLSSIKPVKILKGIITPSALNSRFRSILVVFQFTVSIALIIGTIITYNQIQYMKTKSPGFNKEHVIVLPISDNSNKQLIKTFKEELKIYYGISNVALSSHIPGNGARKNAFVPEGYSIDKSEMMGAWSVDSDFFSTMGMEIVEGRNFSSKFITDQSEAILINETAMKKFGWKNPIGKTIYELDGRQLLKKVIGVVKDFHWESFHKAIEPIYIEYETSQFSNLSIRLNPGNITETISFIKKKWNEINPSGSFDFLFLDESFDNRYRSEEQLNTFFISFTLLAIFIACLGLLGLASYTSEQRTREIGIRKTLGASVSRIVLLLSKDFLKRVLIANIIAWPIGFYFMNKWLEDFAYRIEISWWIFVLSGGLALIIALLTVSTQAFKAATANPVNSLKSE